MSFSFSQRVDILYNSFLDLSESEETLVEVANQKGYEIEMLLWLTHARMIINDNDDKKHERLIFLSLSIVEQILDT